MIISESTSFAHNEREMHVYFDSSSRRYGFEIFDIVTGRSVQLFKPEHFSFREARDAGVVKVKRSLYDELCDLESEFGCTIGRP